MKVIVIDKSAADVTFLCNCLVTNFPHIRIVASANTVKKGIEAIMDCNSDAVFSNVIFSDGSVFDIISQFQYKKLPFILVAQNNDYAIQALRNKVFDYLLKPIKIEELTQVIERFKEKYDKGDASFEDTPETDGKPLNKTSSSKKIVLSTDNSIYVVDLQDILYCEAQDGYTIFYLNNNTKIMVTRTLKEYENMLEPYLFIRTHKTYLVNFNYIIRFSNTDGGGVVLKNNHTVPVSFRKKDMVVKMISNSAIN